MSFPVAEFCGGPRDGEIEALRNLDEKFVFPVMPVAVTYDLADEHNIHLTHPVAVYELAYDPVMYRPSVNDAGRYRYTFTGYRAM